MFVEVRDEQAHQLGQFNYFQFSGDDEALWDAKFNALLAWEGFFTITAKRGRRRVIEPLPELQPFYGVLLWPNFEGSKHVQKMLTRLARDRRGYRLRDSAERERSWQRIEDYHRERHQSNWLTKRYFEMMKCASDDPRINFRMHCIELVAEGEAQSESEAAADGVRSGCHVRIDGLIGRSELNGQVGVARRYDANAGRWEVACGVAGEQVRIKEERLTALPAEAEALAGEIGFSVGGIYTSLSGWTGERTSAGSSWARR